MPVPQNNPALGHMVATLASVPAAIVCPAAVSARPPVSMPIPIAVIVAVINRGRDDADRRPHDIRRRRAAIGHHRRRRIIRRRHRIHRGRHDDRCRAVDDNSGKRKPDPDVEMNSGLGAGADPKQADRQN